MEANIAQAQEAVETYHQDEGADWPTKKTQMMSEARVTAFQNGDHATLDAMDEKFVSDLGPIHSTIEEHGDAAFNQITDQNGKPISFCGNKDAMVWVRITEDMDAKSKAPAEERDKYVYNPTVEVGTMSMNGGKSVWTTSWWKEHIPDLTAMAIAAGVGAVVGRSILSALTKRGAEAAEIAAAGAARAEAQAALDAAHQAGNKKEIDAAIKALREARKVVSKVWMKNLPKSPWVDKLLNLATKFPKISAFLGGTIVSIAISVVFELLLPFVNKDFYIKMEVCNFDTKNDWQIDEDWYHDNGIIAGGSAFENKLITRADQPVETPWGPTIGKFITVNSVTYYFQNSFTIMDGVGICVKAQRADKKAGCTMAYLCSYWKSNQLTVKGEFPSSSKDFYWDKTKWPADYTLAVSDTIHTPEGDLLLKGSTNALNKAAGDLYKFYVGIGKP